MLGLSLFLVFLAVKPPKTPEKENARGLRPGAPSGAKVLIVFLGGAPPRNTMNVENAMFAIGERKPRKAKVTTFNRVAANKIEKENINDSYTLP